MITRIAPSTIRQPGGAEEAADHGIGHIADGAAHPRQAEAAQYDAGHDGREAERDQHRAEQRRRRIGRDEAFDQRSRQNCRHRRGGAVGAGDRKRQRAAEPDHGREHGGAMKVAAMPYDRYGDSGPAKISSV